MCAKLSSDQASCGDGPSPSSSRSDACAASIASAARPSGCSSTDSQRRSSPSATWSDSLRRRLIASPQRRDRRLRLTAQVTRECVPLQPGHAIVIGGRVRAAQCERVQAGGFPVGSQRRGLLGGGDTVADGRVVVTRLVGMKGQVLPTCSDQWPVRPVRSARGGAIRSGRSRGSAPGWPCGQAHAETGSRLRRRPAPRRPGIHGAPAELRGRSVPAGRHRRADRIPRPHGRCRGPWPTAGPVDRIPPRKCCVATYLRRQCIRSGRQYLGDEEWVAAADLIQLFGIDSAAGGERRHRRQAQRRQRNSAHLGAIRQVSQGHRQRMRRRQLVVAEGDHQQQPQRSDPSRQEPHQIQSGAVGPVCVFDHPQPSVAIGQRGQQLSVYPCGVAGIDRRCQRGTDAAPRARTRRRSAGPVGVARPTGHTIRAGPEAGAPVDR